MECFLAFVPDLEQVAAFSPGWTERGQDAELLRKALGEAVGRGLAWRTSTKGITRLASVKPLTQAGRLAQVRKRRGNTVRRARVLYFRDRASNNGRACAMYLRSKQQRRCRRGHVCCCAHTRATDSASEFRYFKRRHARY